jgi:spore coat polysaccharide biosynthesis protein SpsF (cytidylyltransferase family)
MDTAIILQARMGSKRLRGKVMRKINKIPMIHYNLKRISLSKEKNIFLATSIAPENDLLVKYVNKNFPKIKIFRGNENNVFSRFYQISKMYKIKNIIRVTADCPLIDYRIIDNMLNIFKKKIKLDYLSNTTPYFSSSYPDGMDVEIFSSKALEKANKLKLNKLQLEHVTNCFFDKTYNFKFERIDYPINLNYLSLSVDTIDEFKFVSLIIKKLLSKDIKSSLEEIIAFIINYLYDLKKIV